MLSRVQSVPHELARVLVVGHSPQRRAELVDHLHVARRVREDARMMPRKPARMVEVGRGNLAAVGVRRVLEGRSRRRASRPIFLRALWRDLSDLWDL